MRCHVIITRGPNKGKTCGEVNGKCKHRPMPPCSECGMEFDRSTSYYRHIKNCIGSSSESSHMNEPSQINEHPQIKEKIEIKPKTNNTSDDMKILIDRLKQMEGKINNMQTEMREEIKEIRDKPVNFINISVIGSDFFHELKSKLGYDRTIGILTQAGTNPMNVIKALYLDDKPPEDYPIACRNNNHFRYLNIDREIIDDQGGSSIGKVMSDRIRDAILLAANEIITSQLSNEDSIYDIGSVQKGLTTMSSNNIIKELASITNNPQHPFFNNGKSQEIK
jgi:hypothetical protein